MSFSTLPATRGLRVCSLTAATVVVLVVAFFFAAVVVVCEPVFVVFVVVAVAPAVAVVTASSSTTEAPATKAGEEAIARATTSVTIRSIANLSFSAFLNRSRPAISTGLLSLAVT